MQEIYRSAASILVLRPVDDTHQILLLHKPRKKDAWQLPQGGVEAGENVTEAALRELKEEAGLDGCRVLGTSERIYQYDFPESFRRFRPDNVKGQRIQYVFALAPGDAVVKVDDKEVNGFVWVELAGLGQYVRRGEYLDLVQALYEEALRGLGTGLGLGSEK